MLRGVYAELNPNNIYVHKLTKLESIFYRGDCQSSLAVRLNFRRFRLVIAVYCLLIIYYINKYIISIIII